MARLRFRHESASAEVVMAEEGVGLVIEVYSYTRGQGHASGLMQAICKWADRNDITLILVVQAYGSGDILNNRQLEAFYRRFGFQVDPEWSMEFRKMYRYPSRKLHGS